MEDPKTTTLLREATTLLEALQNWRAKRPESSVPAEVGQFVALESIAYSMLAIAESLNKIASHGIHTY